jgi:hypothetical protein
MKLGGRKSAADAIATGSSACDNRSNRAVVAAE